MKTTKLISGVVSILIVLAFTMSYAEEEKAYVPKDDEKIYGTWANPDYNGLLTKRAKWILRRDGTWASYFNNSDTHPHGYGTFAIAQKWTDSEGNIWMKHTSVCKAHGVPFYTLIRFNNSAKTMELIWDTGGYPAEMSPNHPRYHTYHRE